MKPYSAVPTALYSSAFLAKAWEGRSQLNEFERRGFAQFFYATICGHLENVFAAHITARIRVALIVIKWDSFAPATLNDSGMIKQCSLQPVTDSIKSVLSHLLDELEVATLDKLTKLYATVFAKPLTDAIGLELHQDLKALAAIRNLFVHGRDFYLEFKDLGPVVPMKFELTLDSHPLQHAADQLYKASIIKRLDLDGTTHDELRAAFYSDEGLLYFHKAVREIEEQLKAHRDFQPENNFAHFTPLPPLK
jgi:hypothetical protein